MIDRWVPEPETHSVAYSLLDEKHEED